MRSLAEIKERSDTAHLMIAKFGADGEKTVCYQSMEDIPQLLTTIESQKEEIEALHDALEMLPPKDVEIKERTKIMIKETVNSLLMASLKDQLEHQKAITELAVKGLKYYSQMTFRSESKFCDGGVKAKSTLSEIERLQNDSIS